MSYTIPAIAAHPHLYPPSYPLAIVAAVARHGVIGRNGQLPWQLPEDLKFFRMLTLNHTVIMGRKTWQSLPHALPQRRNIVVTRQPGFAAPGAQTATSLAAALNLIEPPTPAFCIGGSELYRQALSHTSTLFLTEIEHDFTGDTHFPEWHPADWRRVAHEAHRHPVEGWTYAFNVYVRKTVWDALPH